MAPLMSYARVMTRPGFEGICIGPYHVLDMWSGGPLKTKFLVRHILTNRMYSLKAIDMCYLRANVSKVPEIGIELKTLMNLHHPNLISVHEVLASTTHVFFVTDVATGVGIMDALFSSRGIDEVSARKILRQVIDVISLCHAFGVYHREINPECIILTPAGQVQVAGFGLSCMKDYDNPRLPSESRSLHFSAPEVWTSTGEEYDGAKADAFSVGVLLYMLLTKRSPFDDRCELGVLAKVHSCSVVYPLHLSNGVIDLLSKLIVRDPGKRWTLAMVKLHPWYLADENDEAYTMIADGPLETRQKRSTGQNNLKANMIEPKNNVDNQAPLIMGQHIKVTVPQIPLPIAGWTWYGYPMGL